MTSTIPTYTIVLPYTTLFRSWVGLTLVGFKGKGQPAIAFHDAQSLNRRSWVSDRSNSLHADSGNMSAVTGTRQLGHRDRKSTRLNSSHQIITYAVFCLKQKNS